MAKPRVRETRRRNKLMAYHPAERVAAKLALRGGAVSHTTYQGTWLPWCDNPVQVVVERRSGFGERGLEATMKVPCRRCDRCLLFRQLTWRDRAAAEVALSKRTWFLTLTFSPVHLAGILAEARSQDPARIERAAYRHVQLYLKRVRKAVPRAKVRYLAIYERGAETGRSHYHLLIHEVGERPISKRVLEEQWRSHVHARLVDAASPGAASYVTKYLTKSVGTRPRASDDYGHGYRPRVKKSASL